MIDLHYLVEQAKASKVVDVKAKSLANSIISGLLYTNSWGGRPGEWESLTRAKVDALPA